MIHLNPIEYPKLIKRTIKISQLQDNIFTVVSNDCRIFYGKRLTIVLDNTTYIGRYSYSYINEEIKTLLIFDDKENLPANGIYTVYETFVIPEDNQAITYQDLFEKLEFQKVPAKVDNVSGINDIGSYNLVDGFQTLKIDQSLYGFKIAKDIVISENINELSSITVKIDKDKFTKYQLCLYSQTDVESIINLELGFANNGNEYYIKNNSHFAQEYSFQYLKNYLSEPNYNTNNDIIISLSKVDYNLETYVTIYFKTENVATLNYSGYVFCKHPQDLWVPDQLNTVINSGILKLNGQKEIKIDQTLLYADKCGEQRTITWGESIYKEIKIDATKVSDIVLVNLPVGYYKIERNTAPYGIPGKTTDSSILTSDLSKYANDYSKLEWANATLVVLSNNKYMLYTNKKHIFIGTKNSDKDIEWHLLSEFGHKHSTDDLTIGNNKFVTQEQIDEWTSSANKLKNYSWKQYLLKDDGSENTQEIRNSLNIKGYAGILFDEFNNPIIYVNDGNGNLIPTSIGVLTVESKNVFEPYKKGTLIKQETLDKVLGLGIGYRTSLNNEQYILINNLTNNYPDKTSNKRFFDLVKRTTIATPGNNSINFGFENIVAKENSILIGIGLNSNTISIGKWNKPVDYYNQPIDDVLLDFGIGTDNENRKSAFWYTENLLTVNGNIFNNNINELGYILINGKEPIINDFVHQEEFNKVKNKVDDITDNSVFIKLIPADINIKPIVQRLLAIDDYSEYNIYNVIVKLNDFDSFGEIESQQFDEDGNLISIIWKLKDNYKFSYKLISTDIENEDEDDEQLKPKFEEISITSKNFDDNGVLSLCEIQKSSIIKIENTSNGKFVEINMIDYINSLSIIGQEITLNVTEL